MKLITVSLSEICVYLPRFLITVFVLNALSVTAECPNGPFVCGHVVRNFVRQCNGVCPGNCYISVQTLPAPRQDFRRTGVSTEMLSHVDAPLR